MRQQLARLVLAAAVWMSLNVAASAESLFTEVAKDLGSAPRGAILTHHFTLRNSTASPLHVSGLRSSCGCATVTIAKTDIPAGESTSLTVVVDTNKFSGQRTFTLYVHVDRPFVEEVRLQVHANSREDIHIHPAQLTFGRVKQGSTPTMALNVEYRGRAAWQITGIENENGYLEPQLQELRGKGSQRTYQLSVKLRQDTPIGSWHADIWLRTNDPSVPRIRVPLVVDVEASLTATPSSVAFGRVAPGAQAQRKVVIRGTKPFKVVRIEGSDEVCQVKVDSDASKNVHVLQVDLQAAEATQLNRRIRVFTDSPEAGTVDFAVQAQIAP